MPGGQPPDPLTPEVVPLDALSLARNLVSWAYILFTCGVVGPPVVLSMILLYPFGLANRWGDFTVWWWLAGLRWLWRVEVVVDGLEHVGEGQTYVVAANHRSHLDAVACILGLRPKLRFGFIVKRMLALIPIWGWFIWLNGYVPVDRGKATRRDQLGPAVRYLKRSRSVLVFPEGTRAPGHRFLPFKKGISVLAIRASVPILPVVVSGTLGLLPKWSLFVRPGRVRVEVLPPVSPEGYALDKRDALLAAVKASMVPRYRFGADAPPVGEEPTLLQAVAPRV